jgi:hypothetical protein
LINSEVYAPRVSTRLRKQGGSAAKVYRPATVGGDEKGEEGGISLGYIWRLKSVEGEVKFKIEAGK